MIMSSACTKKKDEPDDAVIVDNDTEVTDENETEETEKEEQSEDKTEPPAPEDDKTVIPDDSEKEDITEKPEQTPEQTPEKDNNSSTEQTPEKKPDEKPEKQPEEEPVVYDDSNATPASSFKYRVDKPNNEVHIQKFIGNEKDVVIPNYIEGYPVRSINDHSFMNAQIESLVISENVEYVYDSAFENCENLKTIVTKSKNLVIGSSAFKYCSSLSNLTLGEGVVEVGSHAFTLCPSLKIIHIPSTLNKCGTSAFGGLAIEKLTFAEGIETIGSSGCFVPTFFGEPPENSYKSVTVPASVKKLVTLSFGENLQEITFLGNAPQIVGEETLLPENVVIKYKKGTIGWDDPVWKDYTLVEFE